jgi:flagellar hook assembly protein FlgD
MRPGRGGAPNPLGLRVSPQPVRDEATVTFVYAEAASVSLEIRAGDVSGPVVRRFATIGLLPATRVRLRWDGRDDAGQLLAPGTYVALARVSAGGRHLTASTAFERR